MLILQNKLYIYIYKLIVKKEKLKKYKPILINNI